LRDKDVKKGVQELHHSIKGHMSFAVVKEVSDWAHTIQSQTEEFDKLM